MTFGAKVARFLSERQRTQRWLARKVFTSPNTISKVVNGGNTSYRTAQKVARVLEVDANWLLDDRLEWPPPLQPSLANIGQQELVAELARRRELVRKDMRNIAAKFSAERLAHLDRIASWKRFSEAQQVELQQALRDLLTYSALETQLEWLDPDAVHPTTKLARVEKLLEGYTHLSAALDGMRDERKTGLLASPLAAQRAAKRSEAPRCYRDGATLPDETQPVRSRSRSTPKRRSAGEKSTETKPKKPKPRTTGKESAPAKPKRPKRPPRS